MSPSAQLVIGTIWSLQVLSFVFVVARIYIRLYKLRTKLFLADCIVIGAWIMCLGTAVVGTELYYAGVLNPTVFYADSPGGGATFPSLDDSSIILTYKLVFASALLYDTGLYFPKFSLLALYFTWISPAFPILRKTLYVLTGYVYASCIVVFFAGLFWCIPVSNNWSVNNADCHLVDDTRGYLSRGLLNITSDVLIFILPFFLLRYLRFGQEAFLGALLMFLLGFITIATTIVRFILVTRTSEVGIIYILYGLEFNTSIIVVCLPSLKVFLNEFRKSVMSKYEVSNFDSKHTNTSIRPLEYTSQEVEDMQMNNQQLDLEIGNVKVEHGTEVSEGEDSKS